jgi:hypothetical protein
MIVNNNKELTRLRTRIKEEFIIVKDLPNADIESAMINVDNLIRYLLERSDNMEKVTAVLKDIAEGNGDNCKDCVYNAEQARQILKEIKQ